MSVTPLPPGPPLTPVSPDSTPAACVAFQEEHGVAQVISALGKENPMGKTEGLRADGPYAKQAPPTEVVRDLKQALDNLPFDILSVFTVVHALSQQIRKANVLARDSELMAQFNALMKSADVMQTATDLRLSASVLQATIQVLMAGHQAYASGQAAIEAANGVAPQNEAKSLQDQAKTLNNQAEQLELQAKSAPAATAEPAIGAEDISAMQKTPSREASQSLEDFVVEPRTAEQFQSEARMLRQQADHRTAAANEKLAEVKAINAYAEGIKSEAELDVKLFEGLAGVLTALLKFGAETSDVSAKVYEVNAKQHESASAQASDAIQRASEILRDALQKMESVAQARTDTNRAIARNLG
ncbi:MAG: type III secretion system translocon subunit SctB [Comamonas sp.]